MVTISPQLPERSHELIEKHKLTFDILRDEGNQTAKEYGLVWEVPQDLREVLGTFGIDVPASNGEPSWTLPMPARYIIDPSSVVRYARVEPDHTHRPEPAETVEALRRLAR